MFKHWDLNSLSLNIFTFKTMNNGTKQLSVLLFTILTLWSQTVTGQTIDWGAKGGITLSSHLNNFWYIEDDIRLNLKPDIATGYTVGLLSRANISKHIRIQTEPSINLLGGSYDDSFSLRGTQFETDSRTKLLYVQMPIIFQLTTAYNQQKTYGRKRARTTWHLSTGFFGGYLLDARFEGTNTGAPIGIAFEGDFANDVLSQYSKYDAGPLFGIGLERGHYQKLGFETRAQYSVIDSGNEQISFFKPQNISISFSLYVLL